MKLDLETIKKLAESVKENNLTEVTVEIDGVKLTLKKEELVQKVVEMTASAPAREMVSQEEVTVTENSVVENVADENLQEVISPMVGTFYSAPSPEAEAFVKVGDKVEVGDTLCIVEAMKMMNEVKSTVAGVVAKINVSNGENVKKGEVLFLIK